MRLIAFQSSYDLELKHNFSPTAQLVKRPPHVVGIKGKGALARLNGTSELFRQVEGGAPRLLPFRLRTSEKIMLVKVHDN